MKIYTKHGDTGETSLFGGKQVLKSNPRVEAYGSVDEANSFVGMAACAPDLSSDTRIFLHGIMSDLFDVGAELATPPDEKSSAHLESRMDSAVNHQRVEELEKWIDNMEQDLPALTTFVLPTGCESSARLHVARTMIRRAERRVVALREDGHPVRDDIIMYLNRLSDLLFVASRHANYAKGVTDIPWLAQKERNQA